MSNFLFQSLKFTKEIVLALTLVFIAISSYAQTEDFEGETLSGTSFTTSGAVFNVTGDFLISEATNFSCGASNTGTNRYLDTGYLDGASSGVVGTIAPADPAVTFEVSTTVAQCAWTGENDGDNNEDGTIRVTGTKVDNTTISENFFINTTIPDDELVPFTFSAGIWAGMNLKSIQFELISPVDVDYLAIDNLVFENISGLVVCPTVGAVAASETSVCVDDPFNVTATGLASMDMTTNGEQDFGIRFVAFTSTPADPYVGGTDLGTVAFGSLTGGSTTAALVGATLGTAGSYEIYAVLSPTPNDATCRPSAMTTITINAAPSVTLSIPANMDEFCLDDPVQLFNLAGSPTGGVYSGAGVMDLGTGLSFTFNPAVAGVGTHTVTYTVTDANGCMGAATDQIVVNALPTVMFTAPADLCLNDGVQNNLGGGTPLGVDGATGVYSGDGVSDDGNGTTYDFDPAAAGVGTHTITYTYTDFDGCTNSASDDVEVFAIPDAMFTALADLCINAGVQNDLGGGTPTGGVYSGTGVTDDGNGMTYDFDPAAAGVGTHSITYTVGVAGCTDSASDDVEVFALPAVTMNIVPSSDLCLDAAIQLYNLAGSPTGGVYSGAGVTDLGTGLSFTFNPAVAGVGTHTVTYTVTDANGCSNSATDQIVVNAGPSLTVNSTNSICTANNGTASVSSTGGTGAVTYAWSNGDSGANISNLAPGSYTVTATDGSASSCTSEATVMVGLTNTMLTVVLTSTNSICTANNGTASASASGGTAAYTYAWSNGDSGANISNLAPGSYTATATDANGCTGESTVMVGLTNTMLTVALTSTNSICTANNGTASASASGGTAAYTYAWSNGDSGANISNLAPGSYTATATDANGCTGEGTTVVGISDTNPVVALTAPADLCIDAGEQTSLGGGTPPQGTVTGDMGVYSGPGVMDDGNGMTYSFDPADAGVGVHTLMYMYTDEFGCMNSASDDVEVFALPIVTFTAPAPDVCVEDAIVTGLGGGMPTGGVYSGTGVTDDANGMTFSFDPTASAPTGGDVPVTYTFTDVNGCSASATDDIFVDPICCELIVICPPADLGTITCNDVIPTAADDEDSFEALGGDISDDPEQCGTLVITHMDVFDPPMDICNGRTMTRTYTIADDLTSVECVQTLIISTPMAPTITCPDPVMVECLTDIPPVDITAPAVTADCNLSTTISHVGDVSDGMTCPETITRTYRVTDGCGRTADCTQIITINDITPPTLSEMPGDEIVECDAIPVAVVVTATDNCSEVPPVIFVNEIHYDDSGADEGEFLEIAGTAGIDLSLYEIYAYENFDGQFDAQVQLSGIIPNEGAGFGAIAFTRTELPSGFFENGSAEGIALVEIATGEVIKFISYEGTVTASNGPAAGMTSTDIGVQEGSATMPGESLQLEGLDGCPCSDFTWTGPTVASPGLINSGQSFDVAACPSSNEVPVVFTESITPGNCPNEQIIMRTWTATDNCQNPVTYTQTITVEDNNAPRFCDAPEDITLTCELPGPAEITAIDNCGASGNSLAWINEIHYDNAGTDAGEFIEIAGIAGTDLSGYQLLAYDSDDMLDAQVTLSGVIPDESCGYGAIAFFLADLNSQFFENGPEEGRALMQIGVGVVDFISYEGVVNAIDGPAMGMSSTDIGVAETSGTPVGQSVQLTGMGYSGSSFTWTGPTAESPGSLNSGQTIATSPDVTVDLVETGSVDICEGGTITRTWTATDACGNVGDPHTQVIIVLPAPGPMITCPADQVVTCFEDINADPSLAVATAGCAATSIVSVYVKQPLITGGIPGCDGTVYTYIYKAVDDCGRVAECEQQFLIQNDAPTVTVPAGETVECFSDIMVSVSDVTVVADCPGDNVINVLPVVINGPINCPGTTYTYTYRVKDFCNRIVEVDRVFTNGDNQGPIITSIPLDVTTECATSSSLSQFQAESSCGGGIQTEVSDPVVIGTPGCPGSQVRYTYTATDECGRTASHVQVFTIQNAPPVVNCPETLQIFGCEDGTTDDLIDAWLASVTASASCGQGLTVSNNYNGNAGVCIGNGFTNVTFFATDQCGRTSSCVGTIIIIDTEAPIIYQDPQEVLVPCNGATQFIFDNWLATQGGAAAIDGCWGENITWSMNPSNPQLNCDGGPQAIVVEFIATDGCGNASSVTGIFNTKVQPAFINISGQVHREDTEPVADVQVGIEGGSNGLPDMDYTENSGAYGLPELEYEDNLMVVPSKNNDPLNGLSTYDLVLLQKHILGMEILDSPYKRIAADINNSGSISTFDMIYLRRMILFIDEEFQDNTSWRFVEADFVFPNPENPFETSFPEMYVLGGLEEEEADFIGVKIGDLNLDAISNFNTTTDDRSGLENLELIVKEEILKSGEAYQIDFTAANFEQINGFQFTINIDQNLVEVVDLQGGDLVNFDAKNYHLGKAERGVITISWNDNDLQNLRSDEVLFSLRIVAKEATQLREVLEISSEYTRAEAYRSGELLNVNLSFENNGEIIVDNSFKLFQNQPNPFKESTMIGFNLPESGVVNLEVFDVSGRMIYTEAGEYTKGYNQLYLDRSNLPAGILYYHVNTASDSDSKKMILID